MADESERSQDFLRQWAEYLKEYETSTVLKHLLLRPFFEEEAFIGPILDVGCGTGYFSELLSSRNFEVTGIDAHQKGFPKTAYKAKYLKMNASHLFFPDASFETVLLINVLPVFKTQDERTQALKEIRRVKKAEGLLYLICMAEELYDDPINHHVLSSRPVGELVELDFKKTDGSRLKIMDNVMRKTDIELCLALADLKTLHHKHFYFEGIKPPIYIMYKCQ